MCGKKESDPTEEIALMKLNAQTVKKTTPPSQDLVSCRKESEKY